MRLKEKLNNFNNKKFDRKSLSYRTGHPAHVAMESLPVRQFRLLLVDFLVQALWERSRAGLADSSSNCWLRIPAASSLLSVVGTAVVGAAAALVFFLQAAVAAADSSGPNTVGRFCEKKRS